VQARRGGRLTNRYIPHHNGLPVNPILPWERAEYDNSFLSRRADDTLHLLENAYAGMTSDPFVPCLLSTLFDTVQLLSRPTTNRQISTLLSLFELNQSAGHFTSL
jgi:hypothetical protein